MINLADPLHGDRLFFSGHSGSIYAFEEFFQVDGKAFCQSFNIDQGYIARAPLDIAEIGPMNSRPLGQLFLRQFPSFTQCPDCKSETYPNISCCKTSCHCIDVNVM